jgi:hypothetical protein
VDLGEIQRRLAVLERRVASIESRLEMRSTLADSFCAVEFGEGDNDIEAIPPLVPPPVPISTMPPWAGRSTLVTARLTSSDFQRATCREVVVWTAVFTVVGALVAVFRVGPWYSPFVGGALGFVVPAVGLMIFNRLLLFLAVREQGKVGPRYNRKVKSVEVVERTKRPGSADWMAYLYLSESDRELFSDAVLEEIAQRAVEGGDLTVRGRVGGIVSDGPWVRLTREWERLGWFVPSRGNRKPRLTRRGVVHLSAMAGFERPVVQFTE